VACDACCADVHYKEYGTAFIGGLGAGLLGQLFPTDARRALKELCPKHRQSLCRFFDQITLIMGRRFSIVESADGEVSLIYEDALEVFEVKGEAN
jgi:hypothetical protein